MTIKEATIFWKCRISLARGFPWKLKVLVLCSQRKAGIDRVKHVPLFPKLLPSLLCELVICKAEFAEFFGRSLPWKVCREARLRRSKAFHIPPNLHPSPFIIWSCQLQGAFAMDVCRVATLADITNWNPVDCPYWPVFARIWRFLAK